MSETTALVPLPFYAPVRTGSGSPFNLNNAPNDRFPLVQGPDTVASEPDDGVAYRRDGCLIGNACIGGIVNIYV